MLEYAHVGNTFRVGCRGIEVTVYCEEHTHSPSVQLACFRHKPSHYDASRNVYLYVSPPTWTYPNDAIPEDKGLLV